MSMIHVGGRRRFLRHIIFFAPIATVGLWAATPANAASATTASGQRHGRWIEVELESQRLVAWEDGRMVLTTAISSGTLKTPTPKGTFRIYRKFDTQRMTGPGYDLPNVPWVMYFRKGGYALHGTYWHSNFGRPVSRGCINLSVGDAAWLYQWAPAGTSVIVH
jgi:lipoprotein-anchoring transpeptidase ErfK/SrfK